MRRLLLGCLAVLMAGPVSGQNVTPTSYTLRVYAQGATTATTTLSVPYAQWLCNQPPVNGSTLNPTAWFLDDIKLPGKLCLYSDAARFQALPDGAYEATVSAVNADGSSAETSRYLFTRRRATPPDVPTGFRLF